MEHDYTRWKAPQIIRYASLESFFEAENFADGIHAIEVIPGHILDILVRKRKSANGLVVFNAAVNRSEFPNPPVLYGQGIASAVNATLISISDLALTYDPKIEMGWHAGASGIPMQQWIPKILAHLRQALDIKKMVLFGGSAGGFAAIHYGQVMDNVMGVAANPQTVISRFFPRQVEAYARICWGWDGISDIDLFLDGVINQKLADVCSLHKKPFLFYQNKSDWHVEDHARPFMEALGNHLGTVNSHTGQGYVEFVDWGDGHAAPPKEKVVEILSGLYDWQGTWAQYIDARPKAEVTQKSQTAVHSGHDYSRWNVQVNQYDALDDFLEKDHKTDEIAAITLAPSRVLDILVKKRNTKKGLVFFAPAVLRKTIPRPPSFYGQSIAAAVDATLISVSELALTYDSELELGWHAGAYDVPLQSFMPQILKKLKDQLGLERIVFTGISAGGFAAMYYAHVLGDAFPIAINPQTQISKYNIRRVEAYARICWNWDGQVPIERFLDGKIAQRLAPLYSKVPKPFLYTQNVNDYHVGRHAQPFAKALGFDGPAVSGHVGAGYVRYCDHWGEGHAPPSREEIITMVNSALGSPLPWDEYVKTLGKKA